MVSVLPPRPQPPPLRHHPSVYSTAAHPPYLQQQTTQPSCQPKARPHTTSTAADSAMVGPSKDPQTRAPFFPAVVLAATHVKSKGHRFVSNRIAPGCETWTASHSTSSQTLLRVPTRSCQCRHANVAPAARAPRSALAFDRRAPIYFCLRGCKAKLLYQSPSLYLPAPLSPRQARVAPHHRRGACSAALVSTGISRSAGCAMAQ